MAEKVRAQIAIWVVVAVVLVASIILFFLIQKQIIVTTPGGSEATFDVESYIKTCSSGFVNEVVDKMLPQGGFVSPKNTVKFNDINIEYTCKNSGFYKPCIQQHPMLITEMENEIKNTIFSEVDKCFLEMESSFKKRGSQVSLDRDMNLNVDLQQDKIILNIQRKIKIERNDETRRGEFYNVEIPSPAYNLAKIAAEISDQESRYCYFEFVGFGILYPRYEVKKFQMSEPTKIYTIKDLRSGKEMNIAIRSCAIPAGI